LYVSVVSEVVAKEEAGVKMCDIILSGKFREKQTELTGPYWECSR
jgi:hypothetical protein